MWTGNGEAAAMEEGKDRLLGLTWVRIQSRLGPDIKCETVFILCIPEATGEFVNDREPVTREIGKLRLWCNVRWAITALSSAIPSLARQIVTYAF